MAETQKNDVEGLRSIYAALHAAFEVQRAALESQGAFIRRLEGERDDVWRLYFREGASYALYALCKELDVPSEDVRGSVNTIDGMAAQLADRIREAFSGHGDEGGGEL